MKDRQELLEQLEPLIDEFIKKSMNGRFQDYNSFDLRVKYCNALSRLLSIYSQIYKDMQIDEVIDEIEKLKREGF